MLEKHIKAEKKEKHESDMWNGKSGNGSCVACHESGDMMNCDVCHLSIHLECAYVYQLIIVLLCCSLLFNNY